MKDMLTVFDVIVKYNLEEFDKSYCTQYGNACMEEDKFKLAEMEVKSINIHFPTKHVQITVIQE